jgi:hypothetical protein
MSNFIKIAHDRGVLDALQYFGLVKTAKEPSLGVGPLTLDPDIMNTKKPTRSVANDILASGGYQPNKGPNLGVGPLELDNDIQDMMRQSPYQWTGSPKSAPATAPARKSSGGKAKPKAVPGAGGAKPKAVPGAGGAKPRAVPGAGGAKPKSVPGAGEGGGRRYVVTPRDGGGEGGQSLPWNGTIRYEPDGTPRDTRGTNSDDYPRPPLQTPSPIDRPGDVPGANADDYPKPPYITPSPIDRSKRVPPKPSASRGANRRYMEVDRQGDRKWNYVPDNAPEESFWSSPVDSSARAAANLAASNGYGDSFNFLNSVYDDPAKKRGKGLFDSLASTTADWVNRNDYDRFIPSWLSGD